MEEERRKGKGRGSAEKERGIRRYKGCEMSLQKGGGKERRGTWTEDNTRVLAHTHAHAHARVLQVIVSSRTGFLLMWGSKFHTWVPPGTFKSDSPGASKTFSTTHQCVLQRAKGWRFGCLCWCSFIALSPLFSLPACVASRKRHCHKHT